MVAFYSLKKLYLDFCLAFHYNLGTSFSYAPIAQRSEQTTHNRLVAGSIPAGGTNFLPNPIFPNPELFKEIPCFFG